MIKIDYSQLANQKPEITYPTDILEKNNFIFKFALSKNNSVYKNVIDKCEKENIEYRVIENKLDQNHVWIKKEYLNNFI